MISTKKTKNGFLGPQGESDAEKYLKSQGFKVLEKNYRIRSGEIDVVALKKGELHFVEVKARRNKAFGAPEEAVSYFKKARLSRAAQHFLMKNPKLNSLMKCFSVVAITYGEEEPHVDFFPHAFELEGGY